MGKEGELLVTIDEKVYDLTHFKEVHPGGRYILEQYHEKDATEVFWSFHGKEGHERLSQLKGVPVSKSTSNKKIDSFRLLRRQLLEEGYFEPNVWWQTYKSVSCVGFLVLGTIATYFGYWLMGAILCGIGYQQLGWLGHDACHHGLTKNRKLNNALGYFFGNVLNGFSVNWWKDRHNSHHAITNVLDADPDVDNLPLFVWSAYDLTRIVPDSFASIIVPYQHWYFIPFTTTLKLIWGLQSIVFLRDLSVQNKSYQRSLRAERLTLILHYVLVFLVLRMTPSITAAIMFFLISEGIAGSGIALVVFFESLRL